ncbi:MAG: hypothetical protein E7361_03950 [Clostridiales bacterium]|nr:hypothetical protein [Clostridiales bacterium]
MSENDFDISSIKRKLLTRYPAFGYTIMNAKFISTTDVRRASTDGVDIYYNPKYMANISELQQLFVMAHEVCHIELDHISRRQDKHKKTWNYATDAVINQYLIRDGLEIIPNGINIEDAINYDAEELYNRLMSSTKPSDDRRSKTKKTDNLSNSGALGNNMGNTAGSDDDGMDGGKGNDGENGKSVDEDDSDSDKSGIGEITEGHDDHEMWDKSKVSTSDGKKKSEKKVFDKNSKDKSDTARKLIEKLSGSRRGLVGDSVGTNIGVVGEAQTSVTDWKRLLKTAIEKDEERWGHKFSDKGNGYATRLEDYEPDDDADVEVILDTSSSVSEDLLKTFLRQVKKIARDSNVKLGTFSTSFHGFQKIRKVSEIDNLYLDIRGGTNFNEASKAFSKSKDVTKICFTDGEDGGHAGIKEKRKDIIWISYGNPDFKPDDGRVIYVPVNEIVKE